MVAQYADALCREPPILRSAVKERGAVEERGMSAAHQNRPHTAMSVTNVSNNASGWALVTQSRAGRPQQAYRRASWMSLAATPASFMHLVHGSRVRSRRSETWREAVEGGLEVYLRECCACVLEQAGIDGAS